MNKTADQIRIEIKDIEANAIHATLAKKDCPYCHGRGVEGYLPGELKHKLCRCISKKLRKGVKA